MDAKEYLKSIGDVNEDHNEKVDQGDEKGGSVWDELYESMRNE